MCHPGFFSRVASRSGYSYHGQPIEYISKLYDDVHEINLMYFDWDALRSINWTELNLHMTDLV